jgi:hypothetical protein
MNRLTFHAAALGLLVLVTAPAWAQLANGGFESPITTDGPPFVGSWEGFNGGTGALTSNSNNVPHSGNAHLLLSISNSDNNFAGVFQDVPNLTPGAPVTFSGFHMTPSNPLGLGIETRIEWRNAAGDTEVSRTPNLTTPPTGQYTPFSLSSVVPAGADTARVVYAIQTFGSEPSNNGTVYVDDVSFVPEPGTAFLVGAGAVLLMLRRAR